MSLFQGFFLVDLVSFVSPEFCPSFILVYLMAFGLLYILFWYLIHKLFVLQLDVISASACGARLFNSFPGGNIAFTSLITAEVINI